MSARGARSRKVQQKDIEKKEKKVAVQGKAVQTSSRQDEYAKWRSTPVSKSSGHTEISRSVTVSSHATSRSSSTNNSQRRSQLNALRSSGSIELKAPRVPRSTSDSASVSGVSSRERERVGHDANGQAARSRYVGGDVSASHGPPQYRTEPIGSYPTANQKSWSGFKVWEGGEEGMRPYLGFDRDEDMQEGSVLVYFKEEQADENRPLPSLRADLKILENSGSTWINNALLYGRIDNDDDEWTLPSSPESMIPPQPFHHGNLYDGQRKMLAPVSPGGQSPPPLDIDQAYGTISSRTTLQAQSYSDYDRSERPNSPGLFQRSSHRNPTHEIWFTAPASIKTVQDQRLHHVAVRNFLAMLHGKPIVGADLFDMLNTLQPEIQIMYDLESDSQSSITPRERSVQMLTNYLGQHGVNDIRNNVKHALGLLAWSEQDGVKWRQGYLESFVHLAGLMSPHMEALPEFKRLSIVTRRNLGIAGKTLQLHVMEAEEKLAAFDFDDLWEETPKLGSSPVYQSYQAFRQFLTNHYTRTYGKWPPDSTNSWLDRKIVLEMQEDLGSLYDYLVDRDVVWNPREERASRKWEMANHKVDDFKADLPELGMTDMLIRFDSNHGYTHIPHPYPLLPKDVAKVAKESKKGFFASLKKDKNKVKDTTKEAKAHLQLSIVFGDATNMEKLGATYTGSVLIDKFEHFELTTDPKHATPREARLGRWVLLYAVLQVLSTLSVDIQNLKHTDDVRYFLCADLARCPDWVTQGQTAFLQASQRRSWCWQRTWDLTPVQTAPVELDAGPHHGNGRNQRDDDDLTNIVDRYRTTHPPPAQSLDGATLAQDDVRHLADRPRDQKINNVDYADRGYAIRPDPPPRSPLRNSAHLSIGEYPFRTEEGEWPVPPVRDTGKEGEGGKDGGWM
ncbi:hypothetical protein P153DRAFT_285293 [Dothidotthia symphoricarpi CBS 119687]|uniref:DUF8004 domain-containing protein n=1 Tax=Dothidotthia symphoricarpi CBS 119687 TaxID=1392245 RepID=A0A6A6AKG6_9PLEO|nr:uncharacterized protein P153DRAFT_285293 [Dothidotthia symphoricarpi CBS 119687]KAF2132046.1 hypothetical protein P153DRAFT_285293 [Dothidotthia symphoricarpi CBS 119687]